MVIYDISLPISESLVIVSQNKIIARGRNQREKKADPLAHAEMQALHAAAKELGVWNLSSCSLIVTLEPCPMCLGAIQQARIDKVICGARDNKGGAIELGYTFHQDQRMHHRFEVQFLEDARCADILSQFFKVRRN